MPANLQCWAGEENIHRRFVIDDARKQRASRQFCACGVHMCERTCAQSTPPVFLLLFFIFYSG